MLRRITGRLQKLTLICSGVLESLRSSCVSVTSFVGMRLRISTFNGRISWCIARYSVITKIFSLSKIAVAGSESGILIGIMDFPFPSQISHIRFGGYQYFIFWTGVNQPSFPDILSFFPTSASCLSGKRSPHRNPRPPFSANSDAVSPERPHGTDRQRNHHGKPDHRL